MNAAMAHARTRLPPRAPIVADPALLVRDDDGTPSRGTAFGTWLKVKADRGVWSVGRIPITRLGFDIISSDLTGSVEFGIALTSDPAGLNLTDPVMVTRTGTVQEAGHFLLSATRDQFSDALASIRAATGSVPAEVFVTVSGTVAPGGCVRWQSHQRSLWN